MAKKLKQFPVEQRRLKKHPWNKWCDGSIWEAVQGEDFDNPMTNFRAVLYIRAKHIGKKVRVHTKDKSIVFQFYDAET